MSSDKKDWQIVASRLDVLAGQMKGKKATEIRAIYEAALYELDGKIASDAPARLELRRRVAEGAFFAIYSQTQDLEALKTVRDEIRNLGFSNISQQATVDTVFARALLRAGIEREAREVLEGLLREIESQESTGNVELIQFLRSDVLKLLPEA
jgi:hypothetical protein